MLKYSNCLVTYLDLFTFTMEKFKNIFIIFEYGIIDIAVLFNNPYVFTKR